MSIRSKSYTPSEKIVDEKQLIFKPHENVLGGPIWGVQGSALIETMYCCLIRMKDVFHILLKRTEVSGGLVNDLILD